MGWIPNEAEALELLLKYNTPQPLVEHVKAVTRLAKKFAERVDCDMKLVVAGALLHDIGRTRTHGVKHGAESAKILRENNVDHRVVRIAETHVGAGIPKEEAETSGLPPGDYVPQTIEEKIVCYADKLVSGASVWRESDVIYDFKRTLGENHPAIKRMKDLFKDMHELLGVKSDGELL